LLFIAAAFFGVQSNRNANIAAANEAEAVAQATAAYEAQQTAEAEKDRADTEATNAVAQATAAYEAQQIAEAEEDRADTEAMNANKADATAQAQRDAAEAELNFYQVTDPAARLTELAELFSRPEPESQAKARSLFFGLPSPDQLALLRVTDKPEELATVSWAILPGLADINGAYATDIYLGAMYDHLADTDLQAEIESWLAAREAAQAGEPDTAVALYTELLEMDDQNPAFWCERGNAQSLVGDSLADFSEVIALAQAPEYQPSGTLPAEWQFVNTEQMEAAVARMLMVYPALAAEVEANPDNYPNLADITLPTYVVDDMEVEMVLIPAGSFNMGSNSLSARADESPVHRVELDEFYIDQYEVTHARFVDFLNDQGNQEEEGVPWLSEEWSLIWAAGEGWQIETDYDDHPVTGVSWYGASAYCNWRGGQLPTEAQWEKAARGDDERTYPWGEELGLHLANYYRGDTSEITPVGTYPNGVSAYGAYDMAGNVSEWVADAYDSEYYITSSDLNPAGPEDDQNISDKVVRGGSWSDDWLNIRASARNFAPPDSQAGTVGFRCAQSVP
jgi:formylglycine-generating enzyme required for sulfatase activity